MWTQKISFTNLCERLCWKVEFFCGEFTVKTTTQFPLVTLKEILSERCEFLTPQDYPEKDFQYIGLENIQSQTGDLINLKKKCGREIRSRSKIFHSGDILYGRLRPYLNKVYLVEEKISQGICSTEIFVLIAKADKVLPHYLRTVLASSYVYQYACRWQTGAALPRLQLNDLLSIKVPLPPLKVQAEIEEFLIEETIYRQRLVREISGLSQRTLDVVVQSLESGGKPMIDRKFVLSTPN
jgi:type I restriction enzyme S subunit